MRRERTAGKLLQLSACGKTTQIDRREAQLVDQAADGGLGRPIVARQEDHPPPAGLARVGAEISGRRVLTGRFSLRGRVIIILTDGQRIGKAKSKVTCSKSFGRTIRRNCQIPAMTSASLVNS